MNKTLRGMNRDKAGVKVPVKIRKTTQSISRYLYNSLQIQPQILVQITPNS